MINLRITNNRADIRRWTGLSEDDSDMKLWNAGFNLDDWDICIESDVRLVDDPEAEWLVTQMEMYCCGYNEVEYNEKWYYTVHHA